MANEVYANGREIACKAGSGNSPAAFPDVCMTPPENPATPPGIPVPYPNTGFESDTADGSRSVMISGKEVMLKNKSYYKTSTGDEAGCAAKKGVVTSVNRGKCYFVAWSMDVVFEGLEVPRHVDLMTHNHASPQANTPPFPDISKMNVAAGNCEAILDDEGIDVHRHGDANCPRGYQSNHIVQNACLENRRGGGGISTASDYNVRDAPCICIYDGMTPNTEHYRVTTGQNGLEKKWRKAGAKNVSYAKARDENLAILANSKKSKMSDGAIACIKAVVDHYFMTHLGLKEGDEVRVPRTRAFRRGRPKVK